jgi:hypothetical protein
MSSANGERTPSWDNDKSFLRAFHQKQVERVKYEREHFEV